MAYSEILCTDLASVEVARDLGADRIELCSALDVGGVTPGPGLLLQALRVATLPGTRGAHALQPLEVVVLVRPRGGDFVYDRGDFAALLSDVEAAREAGAAGVALGVMLANGEVDRSRTAELVAAARPMRVTFHRAIDRAAHLMAAADVIVELGIDRVLTSGGAPSAWEGRESLRRLSSAVRSELEVVAAAGVTGSNAAVLLAETGVQAVHGSCSRPIIGAGGEGRRTLDPGSAKTFIHAARATPADLGPTS